MRYISILAGAAVMAAANPAAAQEVVMRRPIPLSPSSNPGSPSDPDSPVEIGGPGDPTVSVPPQVVCNEGETPLIHSAAWVSTGWQTRYGSDQPGPNGSVCTERTKSFVCSVEAYCLLPGQKPAYEGDALFFDVDDSFCENYGGDVPTVDPDEGYVPVEIPSRDVPM